MATDGTLPVKRWWRRSPIRLSLRALMVVVLVFGVWLGWLVNSARVQREAIAAIEKGGGKAFYDWQLKKIVTPDFDDLGTNNPGAKPWWPQWIVDRVAPDYLATVKLIIVSGPADPVMPQVGRLRKLEEILFWPTPRSKDKTFGPTDAGMVSLGNLSRLKKLTLGINTANGSMGSRMTGKGLAAIAGAGRLQILELQGIPIADADLAALEGLTDLRMLTIESPNVTDAGLEHLAGLVELRDLNLVGTSVTAGGIGRLRGLTRLKKLNLYSTRVENLESCRALNGLQTLVLARTPIGDDGLAAPASGPGFAGLTNLVLANTRVGDAGLMHLADLPKLKSVAVMETAVTDEGVAAFKQARPGVNVVLKRPPATSRPPRPPTKK